MCCDGSLFGRVNVKKRDDRNLLAGLGFEIKTIQDEDWFPQPCQAVADGCCTVYDDRPRTCRSYRCTLLVRHQDEGLPADQALAIITKATALRDRIRSAMDLAVGNTADMSIAGMRAALHRQLADGADPAAHAQLLLDLATFDLIVQRHFDARPPAIPAAEAAP
jgi:Fe-S-cluster containining protein